MKPKPALLAAIASLGLTATSLLGSHGPALADRPGPGGRPPDNGGNVTPPSTGRSARIISDTANVNLYTAPDFDADTLGRLPTGTTVSVYDSLPGWYYVTGGGLRGWVPSGVVQF